jgi:hypothetical protein
VTAAERHHWLWDQGDIVWDGAAARGVAQDYIKGAHGLFEGARPGGAHLIKPIASGGQVPAAGRKDILTDDPSVFANLSPELQAKLLAKLQQRFPGMTQEQLQANVDKQLELALKDPTNNGMTWYKEAGDEAAKVATKDGYTYETSVGGLAAMSPQQGWGSNLSGAQYMAGVIKANPLVDGSSLTPELVAEARVQLAKKGVTAGDWNGSQHLSDLSSMEAAAYVKASAKKAGLSYTDDMNGKTYKVTWSCGLAGMDNAVRIYRGESPDEVLNGHKVRSFYNNILANEDSGRSITIDTHALSAAVGVKVPAQDERMDVLATPTNRQYSVKGAYSLFADAYRRVADAHGLSPEQVQALVWIQWRKTNP